MYVVFSVSSKCGSRFEAHVVASKETHGPGDSTRCPDCGECLPLPYRLLEPLIKLK